MPQARQLIASRCPECSAPVDLQQIPTGIDQVRCAYCGTPLLLPKRTRTEAPSVYRPPVTPPRGFSSMPATPPLSTPVSSSKGRMGCGIGLALLVFVLMVGADVGVFRALESAWAETAANSRADAAADDAAISGRAPGVFSAEFWQPLGLGWPIAPPIGHLYGPPVPLVAADERANREAETQAGISSDGVAQAGAGLPVQGVLIQGRNHDDQGVLFNFDPQGAHLNWRAEPFGRNFLEIEVAAGPRYIYVADQSRLTALQRETGAQAWQISLANSIAVPCDDCLRYMAGYVVVLTRDGTLQSFDGDSGLPVWSRRLQTMPRRLYDAGGQPAVVDGDDHNRAIFSLLDRATGHELQVIRPTCEVEGREGTVTPAAPFVVADAGQHLYVLGSGNIACIWRYHLGTGAPEWVYGDAREDRVLPFTWSDASYLIRGGVVYVAQRDTGAGVLRAVDSHTGVARELVYASQHELALELAVSDTGTNVSEANILLVRATPTYARNEPELWGIDGATGERRWLVQLEMRHAFDTLLVHSIPPSLSHSRPAGIFVGQCLWEEDVCLFEVLDSVSGVSGGQTRHPVRGSVNGYQFLGDTVWMNIWGKLHAVDLTTAEVELVWP